MSLNGQPRSYLITFDPYWFALHVVLATCSALVLGMSTHMVVRIAAAVSLLANSMAFLNESNQRDR